MWRNVVYLSMKWKLILSFAAIALLFAGTALYQGNKTKLVEVSMETQKAEMENRITVAKITQLLQEMNGLETNLAKSSDLEAVDPFAEKKKQLFAEMALITFAADTDSYQKLQGLQSQGKAYTAYFDGLVDTMNDVDLDPMAALDKIDELHTKAIALNQTMLKDNEQLYTAAADNAEQAQSHSFALLNQTMSISVYAAVFVFIFTIVVAFLLIRSFLLPVNKLQSALRKIADGDLRHQINSSSNDELGRLSHHFDHMVNRVRDMLQQTLAVASSLSAYSRSFQQSSSITANSNQDIVKTIQEISVGAEQQAGQTEQSAGLIQELNQEIHAITAYTEAMLTTSNEANQNTRKGAAAVTELKRASEFSRDSIGKVYEALSRLTELSNQISKITNSITEVSNQTNVLALNAAIEAARAGTYGKGFAVISDEVRKLSEQTKESSVHIGIMIGELHSGMETFQTHMLETKASLEEQDHKVSETLFSFTVIDQSIQEISRQIGQIHHKADTTQARNATLAEAVQNVASIAEETAAAVQEVNASSLHQDGAIRDIARQAVDINELSQRLYQEISAFKIEDETIKAIAESPERAGETEKVA
ncbi:methyl-accepting chemotaxis protein [Paenibacillus sp. R14(2021)]|uniref:methyl-accepting chemotaxis protein n=1 Tax=Paenibacillus sp. R14(2021) TaxID=2859228 RepID=UPI001C6117E7|nr:methyl-accepting chemotaxis protein [Paenibacillus sp. R14(2021)]